MNIALVHDWITNISGAERVLLELSDIFPNAPIYTSVLDKNAAKSFSGKKIYTSFLQQIPFIKNKRTILIPFTPFAFEQFDLSDYDLVISSSTMASKGVLTKPQTIHICYCHTPPRYLWDPDIDTRAAKGYAKALRVNTMHKMRIWDRVAADRVDYFIANSNFVRDRIKKYYKRDAKVIYPPVSIERFKIAKEIKDYFLYVGRLVDYKRCDLAVAAFNKLKLPLYIIGEGPEKARLESMAESNIKFLGHLSDWEIEKFYSEAKAFIFTTEEDFGIVPVEAMASGRPVIAFSGGGATETVIDGATGVFFDQQSCESLSQAVDKFQKLKFDSGVIRKQAEKFSSKQFKKEMIEYTSKVTKINNF